MNVAAASGNNDVDLEAVDPWPLDGDMFEAAELPAEEMHDREVDVPMEGLGELGNDDDGTPATGVRFNLLIDWDIQ